MRKLARAISTHGWFDFDPATGAVMRGCLDIATSGPLPVAVDIEEWQRFWDANISEAGDIDILDLTLIGANNGRSEAEPEFRRELQRQLSAIECKRTGPSGKLAPANGHTRQGEQTYETTKPVRQRIGTTAIGKIAGR